MQLPVLLQLQGHIIHSYQTEGEGQDQIVSEPVSLQLILHGQMHVITEIRSAHKAGYGQIQVISACTRGACTRGACTRGCVPGCVYQGGNTRGIHRPNILVMPHFLLGRVIRAKL